MVFSSAVFLFVFLPVVFVLSRIVPGTKGKNLLLLAASFLFYAFGEPVYVLLMLFSTLVNYAAGRLLAVSPKGRDRWVAAAAVVGVCHTSLLHEKMLRTDPDYRVAVLDERNLALREKAGNIANATNLALMGVAAVVFLGLGYTVPALVVWGLITVNPLILIGISSLLEKRM